MRRSLFLLLVAVFAAPSMMIGTARAAPERHELDGSHTAVAFLVEHVGFARTLGRFTAVSGGFVWDAESRTLSQLRIVVETASVATDNDARDNHVRKKDFLDVKRFPEMVFTIDGPVVVSADSAELDGTLELLGQARPLTLSVTLNKSEKYPFGHKKQTLGISASGALSRSDYGMNYAVGNGLVGDTVELLIEAEAPRAE